MIAEKWNFPTVISQSIRYHHNPSIAPEENKTLCEIVYLANMFVKFSEGKIEIQQFDTNILKKYNLDSSESIENIANKLASAYNREAIGLKKS